MDSLESTLDAVNAALRENEEKQNHLHQEQKEKESEIEQIFESLKCALMERRNAMKTQLHGMIDTQRSALQTHCTNLRNLRDSIMEGINLQNVMITDSISTQESVMEEITAAVLKDFDDGGLNWKWCPIDFVVDLESTSKVHSLYLFHIESP